MKSPVRWFWSMTRNIDRIRAVEDLRTLNVSLVAAAAAQGDQESLKHLRSALTEQMGVVMRFKERPTSKQDILSIIEGL